MLITHVERLTAQVPLWDLNLVYLYPWINTLPLEAQLLTKHRKPSCIQQSGLKQI